MADLPADRVTPNIPLFSFVGVDCFGPFWVKRATSQVRRYGVLFNCLATRAIHFEVAQSMDTDLFVNSMCRFIARRGIPKVMRLENGSNFETRNSEKLSLIGMRVTSVHLPCKELSSGCLIHHQCVISVACGSDVLELSERFLLHL